MKFILHEPIFKEKCCEKCLYFSPTTQYDLNLGKFKSKSNYPKLIGIPTVFDCFSGICHKNFRIYEKCITLNGLETVIDGYVYNPKTEGCCLFEPKNPSLLYRLKNFLSSIF